MIGKIVRKFSGARKYLQTDESCTKAVCDYFAINHRVASSSPSHVSFLCAAYNGSGKPSLTSTDLFAGSSSAWEMFKCCSEAHPVNVKLAALVKWSMPVISSCTNKLPPSDVSMKMLEIFADDANGSMTSLCSIGIRMSSFHAVKWLH